MNSKKRFAVAASLLLVIAFAANSPAANRTWDPVGGGPSDGSGNWDLSTLNWWNGAADVKWFNASNDTAIIGAGGTAGTITLTTNITVGGLTFNATASGNYTITGTNLTFASGATVDCSQAGTIFTRTVASGPITKSGAGTLTLSGTNTFSGTTTVSGGTLTFASSSNVLSGAVTVLGGGTLTTLKFNGPASIANTLTIGNAANDRAVVTITTNVTLTAGNAFLLAATTNLSCGAAYQSGGTFMAGVSGGTSYIANKGYGYYKITGGTLSAYNLTIADPGTDGNSASGVLDIQGGSVIVRNAFLMGNMRFPVAPGDNAVITIDNGGTLDTSAATMNVWGV